MATKLGRKNLTTLGFFVHVNFFPLRRLDRTSPAVYSSLADFAHR